MSIATRWLAKVAGRQDIILSAMLVIAVFMMILPLPTTLVDVLIAVNLGMSIILLMIAIYIRDPLEFSAFPSMLLITTLYRLALTISTSRLILLQHDAGEIVYTFGDFVVGGNLAVGIIVFAIITIVQFIVITKGSERVAEVSARFSLDGMPGKQMSIDGDMRAGIIDAKEAKRQRSVVQKESQLYGAMDGAMKFVKGDAIASVIVILTNIFGGIAVGVLQHNMSASEALNTYAILSVGDGLIAQIPSLLISITAGLIVTRVPGETKNNLANELVQQVSRQPSSLQMAAAVMFVFAVIPGFPWFVFGPLGLAVLGASFWLTRKEKNNEDHQGFVASENVEANGERDMTPGAVPLMLAIGQDLMEENLSKSLQALRWKLFEKLGLPIPEIQVQVLRNGRRDEFELLLYQEPVITLNVTQQQILTLTDIDGLESQQSKLAFNQQILHWHPLEALETIQLSGHDYYQGNDISIHLVEMVAQHYAKEFLGVQETRYLMDSMEMRYAELVKELQRLLPVSKVTEILQRLVEENISIRDLRTIFETLVEWASKEKDTIMLTEYVRVALRRHIRRKFTAAEGWIPMLIIGDSIENQIRESIRQSAVGAYSALEPEEEQHIIALIKDKLPSRMPCVLLTSLDVRRYLRKIVEPTMPMTPVLSFQEIGDDASIKVIAQVDTLAEVPNAIAG
ncbi:EscV/YscV/HrcV family type III secretion system export apparatus protein [Vibrio neptunius]|uniref:EscV/YscV/HrcV family type III secretion system export apparatus protein n=1 Tax=Vibrio neptunius TaxID=170651 RepID=A0ABS3A0E9_9VIBR|nr:EscV/YscV/HrcV family type III secretion system export apparatus protein [Vibrio neptunius]MBN3492012.1 EscV/YscV/HrcV family type III secretion system export apparatus protein [Vibrio neptunius]MBN3514293.1 EscV/YscV/HrcV family type III secretion system export apparatus protein [Vibrio neptunius]MBN3548592.1 EscV/YscV/HrcV family type III secretion system export apparatus protein [Vibrio neptunius]MBN3576638.1 EscV/YscV/HrcV family type III secretion system export apparatus protein [Vibrio